MEIGIKVLAQNIRTQARCGTSTAASSRWSRWTTIASRWRCRRCGPFTPDEKRRYEAAKVRKQLRQELEQRFNAARTPDPA